LLTEDLEIHFLRLSKVSRKRIDMLESIRSDILRHWLQFFSYGHKLTEAKMSSITDNDPAILSAFEQLDRFYADPELRELDRQRRLAMFDQMAINEAEAKGEADFIIRELARRFHDVPVDLTKRVYALTDIERLDSLFDFAHDCKSLEEFLTHLR